MAQGYPIPSAFLILVTIYIKYTGFTNLLLKGVKSLIFCLYTEVSEAELIVFSKISVKRKGAEKC